MASQRKIFKRVGIRRDKNFSDLSDSTISLNNLLDTLVDSVDATFISEDLDAIRNIFATGLNQDGYREFIGSAVQETDTNGINVGIVPRITYQNRLDKFQVSSGFPRLNGGNGLTANYFNEDQVQNTTDIFTGITTGGSIPSDNFWEAGNFEYTAKIHPQSVNTAGGVHWEGFFVPTQTGVYRFSSNGSLGFTADFQTEGYTSGVGTYTEYSRVSLSKSTTGRTEGTAVVVIPAGDVKNIGVGMTASGSGIRSNSIVSGIGNTGVLTLENPDGDPITSIATGTINFTREAGTSVSSSFNTFTLEKFQPYRIRFRFFVPPGVPSLGVNKAISFLFRPPGATSSSYLRYNNLYTLDYDFSESAKGSFNNFLDQSVLFGGGLIGGTSSSGYVRIKSSKKIDIKYTPKTSYAGILRKTFTASWSTGSKVISLGDTTNIEIGNYLFASGLTSNVNTPVRVIDIAINDFIIIDTPTTSSGSNVTINVINHRGFVKRVTASSSAGLVTISNGNTNDLRSNQLAIWDGVSSYTGISTNGTTNQVILSPALGFGTRALYFYESRGLIDKALSSFCVPAQTQCILVNTSATAGDTTLTVDNISGTIAPGWVIQGFPFTSGTTISSIVGNTITVNPAITKNINPGSNFTATNSGGDRSLCCPPTDTSPPFNPTEEGLETTTTSPNLEITGGNIKFDEFNATVNTSKISLYSSTDKSNNRLQLKGGDGITYNILCV
jgi:hypothetical protein